jgi:hypothetical protein
MACNLYSAINASYGDIMANLILDFDSETENGNSVSITATFEPIHDFEETQYGEQSIFYWHLIGLKITHSSITHYEPTDNDYEDYQSEAIRRASKEAA